MSKPNIVLIIGSAYSGSTALGMALHNTGADQAYIGEFSRVPAYRAKYQLDLHDGECTACQIDGRECPVFGLSQLGQIGKSSIAKGYEIVAQSLNVSTLIDASKHPAWLREVAGQVDPTRIRVLISVRNPSGYIQSCVDRKRLLPWQAANAWRDVYSDALRSINQLGLPMMVVRNEKFVHDRKAIVNSVAEFANLKITSRSQKVHALGGNPAPYTELFSARQLKSRAAELGPEAFDLSPAQTRKKLRSSKYGQELLNTPGLCDLATQLGYSAKDLF